MFLHFVNTLNYVIMLCIIIYYIIMYFFWAISICFNLKYYCVILLKGVIV